MAENKNAGNGIALGACFGVVFGAAYGIISGDIAKGSGLGLSIGVFIGAIFDFVKKRKKSKWFIKNLWKTKDVLYTAS